MLDLKKSKGKLEELEREKEKRRKQREKCVKIYYLKTIAII